MKNTGVRKVLFAFLWLTAAIQVFADETFKGIVKDCFYTFFYYN